MTRTLTALALALLAAPAAAQTAYPPPAVTPSDIAAIQAKIPQPATSIPPADMAASGAAGSSPQYRPIDAQAPRVSRTVSGVTGAAGTAAITWAAMPSIPKLTVTPYVGSADTQVATCYPVVGTVTTTGATIKCFRTQTLLGLGLVPFIVAPAGVQFDVLALPGS